jgi:pyrroloquinoline quinone biosynthesis protein B
MDNRRNLENRPIETPMQPICVALAVCFVLTAGSPPPIHAQPSDPPGDSPYLVVLGVAQDGGFPHMGCAKACCRRVWSDPKLARYVSSIALVDPTSKQRWVIDATPDFPHQLQLLDKFLPVEKQPGLDGILLTHAHIGHYTGLMYLGREALGANRVPVYAMPRMRDFLTNHGPWSQLVELQNITLRQLTAGKEIDLNPRLSIKPLVVPHRDEFSETVAFVIRGPDRSALFLPDIDKWSRWGTRIEQVIADVDVALIDGTFFDNAEIPNRDMSEIPHPFIVESMQRFSALPATERAKIQFIHLNHSNPGLQPASQAARSIRDQGFGIAEQSEIFEL